MATSSTSSSTSSVYGNSASAYSTLASRTGMEGLVSGIETSKIIEQYTSATRNKITKQLQTKQQEEWRQEYYQEITKKINDYYNKYFSYSSSSNILKSSFFNTSTITPSSSLVTATGDVNVVKNMVVKDIKSLATQAGFTSSHKISDQTMGGGTLETNWQKNNFQSATLKFKIDDKEYTATIADDFLFSEPALAKDEHGNYTDDAKALQNSELKTAISNAISANSDLNGKIAVSYDDDGKFSFTGVGDTKFKISGGSSSTLSALGMSVAGTKVAATATVQASRAASIENVAGNVTLAGELSGKYVTFNYNGVTQNITFNESEKEQFDTPDEVAGYLQSKLNTAFGEGKVNVGLHSGALEFSTSDSSSILSVTTASASGILGEKGALRVMAGESNRTELTKTLDQLSGDFNTPITKDSEGKYSIKVNGTDFSFDGDTLFGDVLSKINASEEAGVTITYSSVTDSLTVKSDKYGTAGGVDITSKDGSNLAAVLFGTKDSDYTVKEGTDFVANMSFDGGNTFTDVTRTQNAFSIDGVTLSFNGKAEGTEEENITFTAKENTDELYNKVKEFVDGYNEIVDWMNTKIRETKYGRTAADTDTSEYLPLTDEQRESMSESEITKRETKAKTGLLRNDETLYMVENNFRKAMSSVVGDSKLGLYQIGIDTSDDYTQGGKLVIDEEKLKQAIETNKDQITEMFNGSEDGIAYKLKTALEDAAVGNVNGDGLLVQIGGKPGNSNYESLISDRISNIATTLTALKTRLKNEEDRWWNKFSALETYISQMNAQSNLFSTGTDS